ncbi:hypothetical protein BSKO_01173 [Bryopsis sp. KO-2023]|nr:hypothetical protein BSKO_01173 [Bryopsis sp. KO-2023]
MNSQDGETEERVSIPNDGTPANEPKETTTSSADSAAQDVESGKPVEGSSLGLDDVSANVFDRLDQITPMVTTQLQTFCSLAVNQLKAYPPLVDTLGENLKLVESQLRILSNQVSRLEDKTDTFKEENSATDDGFDERLKKIEVVVAAIPAWKEAQMQAIKDTKERCTDRCTDIMDKLGELETFVKESEREASSRLDTLEDLSATNAEIRDKLGDRLGTLGDQLELLDTKQETKNREHKQNWQEHEARLALLDEKLYDVRVQVKGLQVSLESVEARQEPLETSLHLVRADVTAIEREMTGAGQQISALEIASDSLKTESQRLDNRLQAVEEDPRIAHLMSLEPRLDDFQNGVEDSMGEFDERMVDFAKELTAFGVRMDTGHPEMWKIHSDLESTMKEMDKSTKDLNQISHEMDRLQETVGEAVSEVTQHNQVVDELQEAQRRLEANLLSESKKLCKYTDDRVTPMARKYEVESIRSRLDEAKQELRKEIEESKNTVKFDLLHDPSPQVDNMKSYLKQQEDGQARLKERICVLEESLQVQTDRMRLAEIQLTETEGKMQSNVLDRLEEIPKMKHTIQKMGHSVLSLNDQMQLLKNSKLTDNSEAGRHSGWSGLRSHINSARTSSLRPPQPSKQNSSVESSRDTMTGTSTESSTSQQQQRNSPQQPPFVKNAPECEDAQNGTTVTTTTVVEKIVEKVQVGTKCHPQLEKMAHNLMHYLYHQFLEARQPGMHQKQHDGLPHVTSFKPSEDELTEMLQESDAEEVTQNLIICAALLHFRLQDKIGGVLKYVRNLASHVHKLESQKTNLEPSATDPKPMMVGPHGNPTASVPGGAGRGQPTGHLHQGRNKTGNVYQSREISSPPRCFK